MNPDAYWYLATPYSSHPQGRLIAYIEACEQAGLLMQAGINVFSPISHTHGIAEHAKIDGHSDNAVWDRVDFPFVMHARGMILCQLPGWMESKGIARESVAFFNTRRPIIQMTPNVIPFRELQPYYPERVISAKEVL